MTDEQIIYLSPEEELTNVRERLEHAQAQRIILVIPSQTQLRSHVGWRLLHARTRELGKDVLVISSDRQIRSVAKAAGFRVADSQESPPSGGTRPGNRPGRTGTGGRTSPRLRAAPANDRGSSTDIRIRSHPQPMPRDFIASDREPAPQEPESHAHDTSPGAVSHPEQATFETQSQQYGPDHDFRGNTSPPIFPTEDEREFDEHDSLVEDYNVAQSIRQAAQPPEAPVPAEKPGSTPLAHEAFDPFASTEDWQPARLPEQRGAASIDELDEGVPDISEYPTDLIAAGEIEDLGDEGDIVQSHTVSPRPWPEPVSEEPAATESSHIHGMRPRNNRQGVLPEDLETEDALPPVPNQPAHPVSPSSPPRPSATPPPMGSSRPSAPQPIIQPRSRTPVRGAPADPTAQRGGRRPTAGMSRPVTTIPPVRRTATMQSSRMPLFILGIVLILLLIAVLVYGYVAPSADVTITLPSQSFSTPLALTATANSLQDPLHHTVRAQTVAFDKTVTATGSATGSKQVGTTPATGQVIFTNNGPQPVHIPQGVIVSTKNGIQFITTIDALVNTQSSNVGNSFPITVQAQGSGENGNVPAGSITVIPADSLTKIEQASNLSSVSLAVTNPQAITNGGLGTATSVTHNDIETVKTTLDQQLQQQARDWLAKQIQNGDEAGKALQAETVTATPTEGQIAADGKFTERVTLHMTVLIVRAADLQAVAQAAFNAAASKQKANYALAPQQMVSLGRMASKNCTPVTQTTSLTLCYNASGPIAPQVPLQQVQQALAGKSVKDATDYLNSITTSVAGASVTPRPVIAVHPDFFPWLPFMSQHISMHVNVVQAPTAPKK